MEEALRLLGEFAAPDEPPDRLARLTLKMPVGKHKLKGAAPSLAEEGLEIVGEMPQESKALLDGIYGLIGAKTLRDDREAGEPSGKVIRQGTYNGKPIHIAEYYDHPQDGKPDKLHVFVMGEKQAKLSLEALTDRERDEFRRVSGITYGEFRHVHEGHGVTHTTYRDIANVMGQTREIVDAAAMRHQRSKRSRVARFLSHVGMGGVSWRS